MARTDSKIDTPATRADSRPVRVHYELIDKDGNVVGKYLVAANAAEDAHHLWPDQHQDAERAGSGWDIQIADCDCGAPPRAVQ